MDGPLRIQSARVSYMGTAPTLDVSRGSGFGAGLAFAPSMRLFGPTIMARKEIDKLERRAHRMRAGAAGRAEFFDEAQRRAVQLWEGYAPRYLAELRISSGLMHRRHPRWGELEQEAWDERQVRPQPGAWWGLPGLAGLAGPDGLLVLLCWCGERWARAGHCHRVLLGGVLQRLGARYEGEATRELQPATLGAFRRRAG